MTHPPDWLGPALVLSDAVCAIASVLVAIWVLWRMRKP